MPDSGDFNVVLNANVSGFVEGMDEAKGAAQQAYESIVSEFESGALESSFGEISQAHTAMMDEIDERTTKALDSIGNQSEKAVNVLGEMKSAFWNLWTASFAFDMISGAVKNLVKEQTDLTSEIQRTAAELGTNNAEAHAWIDAAELSGVATNALTQASRTMQTQVAAGGKQLKEMGISMTDTNGVMKTTGQLIEETIAKLDTYTASADRNAIAQKTIGRSYADLMANGQALIDNIKQQEQAYAGQGIAQDQLVAQGKQLQAINAQIDQSWKQIAVSAGPALIALLKQVEDALLAVAADAQIAAVDIEHVFQVASGLGKLGKGLSDAYVPEGGGFGLDTEKFKTGLDEIDSAAKGVGDTFNDWGKQLDKIDQDFEKKHQALWVDHLKMAQMDIADAGIGGEGGGVKGAGQTAAPPSFMPKGGGRGGGGGGGEDMTGMDDALTRANDQMQKFNQEVERLGSESQMAAKEGGASFDTLRDRATNDYQDMKSKYEAFQLAVASGSKDAAKQAETAWHESAQKFQQDWEQAKQKAQQDMQQIKSTADQMASEVSGILNQAISGKLNWAQEFQKILSQMMDMLVKHLFEQIAKWAVTETQVNAVKQAGAVEGIAIQKETNATIGISDAIMAAKNAWASASAIPVVGYILAPLAAAAAFAGVESYGSAQAGFEVPPGQSPMVQLHPRELVMPADISGGLKQMIAGGGGRGGTVNQNLNIQSLDPSKLADIVMSNPNIFGQAAALARRNGAQFNTG